MFYAGFVTLSCQRTTRGYLSCDGNLRVMLPPCDVLTKCRLLSSRGRHTMKRNALAASLSQVLFCAALLPASFAATAQNQAPDAGVAGDPKQLDTVVVQG